MRRFEVFPGLHFQQAGFGSLEFKAKAAASIEFGDRCSGRDDDFDVAVVELVTLLTMMAWNCRAISM